MQTTSLQSTITPCFAFKFTAETKPFHVFQAFVQFRKAKFRHWSLHHWCKEIGFDCKATLTNIMQGKELPESELAERIFESMKIDEKTRADLIKLIELYRMKKASKKATAA